MATITKPHSETSASPTIPKTMHAAAIERFGGSEVLKTHKLPTPVVDEGEVLIALHTSGVGIWDAAMRTGEIPTRHPHFPMVLGSDGAGHIAAVGSHVRGFHLGEEVYSYSFDNPKGGFYAEYVVVEAEKAAPIPRGLHLRQAGAIGTTGLTALQGIDDALAVKRGESLLIHGASGSVGTLAVQFAKWRGGRVLAIASGKDGVSLALKLGADTAIDGRQANISAAAREFAPGGIDAVLGLAGGDLLDKSVATLHSGGRLAYPNGVDPPKNRDGIRVVAYDAVPGVREFQHLNMAIEAVKLQVPIAAEFPLGDARRAHDRLAQGHVLGKIVLQIEGHSK
jgi:NADPH2:quinone reductase